MYSENQDTCMWNGIKQPTNTNSSNSYTNNSKVAPRSIMHLKYIKCKLRKQTKLDLDSFKESTLWAYFFKIHIAILE